MDIYAMRSAEYGMSAGRRPWRAIMPGDGTAQPGELLWQSAMALIFDVGIP